MQRNNPHERCFGDLTPSEFDRFSQMLFGNTVKEPAQEQAPEQIQPRASL